MNDRVYDLIEKYLTDTYEAGDYSFTEIQTVKEFLIVFSILKNRQTVIEKLTGLSDQDPNKNKILGGVEQAKHKLFNYLKNQGRLDEAMCVYNIILHEPATLSKTINRYESVWIKILQGAGMSKKRAKDTGSTLKKIFKDLLIRDGKNFIDKIAYVAKNEDKKTTRQLVALGKISKKIYETTIKPEYEKILNSYPPNS